MLSLVTDWMFSIVFSTNRPWTVKAYWSRRRTDRDRQERFARSTSPTLRACRCRARSSSSIEHRAAGSTARECPITARVAISRAGAKLMLRQVGLKGAVDSGKFNAELLDWFVALVRFTPTLLNEIRSTPKVISPVKGLNEAMLFTDELLLVAVRRSDT